MGYRRIDGSLITRMRGGRSMDTVVELSGKAFTKAALSMWENGEITNIRESNVQALLKGLGCRWEHITVDVDDIVKEPAI